MILEEDNGKFGENFTNRWKISGGKKIYIYIHSTDLFNVHFYLELGKKLPILQLRMSDPNERELWKELFEDQS